VPLLLRGQTIGVLSLYCTREDGFNDDELALLAEMVNDILLGIAAFRDRAERRRSESALARQSEQLQLLAGSSRAISAELEEEGVLHRLVASAMELVDCKLGMVGHIVNGKLSFTEMNRNGEIVPIDLAFVRGEGAPGRVMETFRPLICGADTCPGTEGGPEGVGRSMVLVPLFDQKGGLNGILWMGDKRSGVFDDWDVNLLESLSSTVLVAMKNAQVVRRLRGREAELEQANRKLDLIGRITMHDLLNQLTTLNGFLELGRRKAGEGASRSYIDKASGLGGAHRQAHSRSPATTRK